MGRPREEARAGDRIALYGSLMRGLGALDGLGLTAALRYVGPCAIPGRLFDLGDYPGLRPGGGHVVAELYTLEEIEALGRLDEFEGFDPADPRASLYLRERLTLVEPRGLRAWVYVYNHEPQPEERIASGDWRAHLAARP